MTETTYRALKAIEPGTIQRGITAKALAVKLWGNDPARQDLFTAVSNQGNGACSGKKAWLCAGSLAGKLRKKGLIAFDRNLNGYYLTEKGRITIREHESKN